MLLMKHLEETGLQCYSKNFGVLLKSVVTKAEEYKVRSKLKIIQVATYVFLSNEPKLA